MFKYFKRIEANGIVSQLAYFQYTDFGTIEFKGAETYKNYNHEIKMEDMQEIDIHEFRDLLNRCNSNLARKPEVGLPMAV